MANNMTIGPAVMVGGNEVQMTTKGKVQVTNPQGKILTLSQDAFQKQTLKNIDKLENGEDIQYKKDHKALKIATAAVGVAAVTTAVIYHKKIANYMKDFSWKKLWNDITSWFKPAKKDDIINLPPAERVTAIEDARAAFENYDGEAVVEGLKKGKTPEKLGLERRHPKLTKRQREAAERAEKEAQEAWKSASEELGSKNKQRATEVRQKYANMSPQDRQARFNELKEQNNKRIQAQAK